MGSFTPKDALRIGIALVIISLVYSFLSSYFAPKLRPDPYGMMLGFSINYGFAIASFILMLLGLFFILFGIAINKKNHL